METLLNLITPWMVVQIFFMIFLIRCSKSFAQPPHFGSNDKAGASVMIMLFMFAITKLAIM